MHTRTLTHKDNLLALDPSGNEGVCAFEYCYWEFRHKGDPQNSWDEAEQQTMFPGIERIEGML